MKRIRESSPPRHKPNGTRTITLEDNLLTQDLTSNLTPAKAPTASPTSLDFLSYPNDTHQILTQTTPQCALASCTRVPQARQAARHRLGIRMGFVRPQTREEFLAHWLSWAQASPFTNEKRSEAVRRLVAYYDGQGNPISDLDLSGLELSSIPQYLPENITQLFLNNNHIRRLPLSLPASIEALIVNDNCLEDLPQRLPANLEVLRVDRNRLSTIPDNLPESITIFSLASNFVSELPSKLPKHLNELNINNNRLIRLTETLPDSLLKIEAKNNQITSLPLKLPLNLIDLDVSDNQLTHLPNNLLQQLSFATPQVMQSMENDPMFWGLRHELNLCNNPLRSRVMQNLYAAIQENYLLGPRVHFSMGQSLDDALIRPLPEAVKDWFDHAGLDFDHSLWSAFEAEPGSREFACFLDRLAHSLFVHEPTQSTPSRQSRHFLVHQWLAKLAIEPSLRSKTFLISQEASASCADRVLLFFNMMKKTQIAADIETGAFDDNLPQLLSLAKGMFRADQLEIIAREKAQTLRFVDEIEVYLAFEVKLREPLHLPLCVSDMHYFAVSNVTQDDLEQAFDRVVQAERVDFFNYLATQWQPWQTVLQRLAKTDFDAAKQLLQEAFDASFNQEVQARLLPLGLAQDDDAIRTMGVQLKNERVTSIQSQLTLGFLEQRQLLHWLA